MTFHLALHHDLSIYKARLNRREIKDTKHTGNGKHPILNSLVLELLCNLLEVWNVMCDPACYASNSTVESH